MRPKRTLGQNFLKDDSVIQRIVDALNISPQDTVIEIGPGRGALTEKLIATGATVIAIEIDRELVPVLRTQFHFNTNFSVIEADILGFELESILTGLEPSRVKLVGNLPYYISTPIIQKLLEQRHLFSSVVLMLQREVVERITAPPGNSERGFITVMVELAFDSENLFDVPATSFFPQPKVWSAVMRMTPKTASGPETAVFRKLVSSGFAQKRKTIMNNLRFVSPDMLAMLDHAGIDPRRRAETLSLEEWKRLAEKIEGSSPQA